jgi:hypothetical protein
MKQTERSAYCAATDKEKGGITLDDLTAKGKEKGEITLDDLTVEGKE